MNNNVIQSVSSALVDSSIIAFMFNFRGVGKSQGSYGDGIAEKEDVSAALTWLVSQAAADSDRVGLAGYSFGAGVALPVGCKDDRVQAMALISSPAGPTEISQLAVCTKPKLIVFGSDDSVVSPEQLKLAGQKAAEPKQIELVAGADHFWVGYEAVLSQKVTAFFASCFETLATKF
jgi:alpha/beta superfamily hydrolase